MRLPLPIATKLNVTALTYTRQIISNQKAKPLLNDINKYQTEECKSCNIKTQYKTTQIKNCYIIIIIM